MGLFDNFLKNKSSLGSLMSEVIKNGGQKTTGGHDHRYNTGDDRTPAQKTGDKAKKKSSDFYGEE